VYGTTFKYEVLMKLFVVRGDGLRREYPTVPMVGVGAIVVCDGKILLVKRGSKPGRGKWSVPGGLVEVGETIHETVAREVEEETGLDVEVDRLIDVVDSITRDEKGKIRYHFIILDFFVKLKEKGKSESRELKVGDDALEARWVPLSEVEKYDLTKTFRGFLKRHIEELQNYDSCR